MAPLLVNGKGDQRSPESIEGTAESSSSSQYFDIIIIIIIIIILVTFLTQIMI
jgi:ABC-type Na+ efflux pump permease subunit